MLYHHHATTNLQKLSNPIPPADANLHLNDESRPHNESPLLAHPHTQCERLQMLLDWEFGIVNSCSARLSDVALVADGGWVAWTLLIAMRSGSVMCVAQILGVRDNFVAVAEGIGSKVCLGSVLLLAVVSGMFMLGNIFANIIASMSHCVSVCTSSDKMSGGVAGSYGLGWSVGVGIQSSSICSHLHCI